MEEEDEEREGTGRTDDEVVSDAKVMMPVSLPPCVDHLGRRTAVSAHSFRLISVQFRRKKG